MNYNTDLMPDDFDNDELNYSHNYASEDILYYEELNNQLED